MLWQVIVCSLVGGVFAVVGGIILTSFKRARSISSYLTAFAAGVLLSAAFLDLLPSILEEEGDFGAVFGFVLVGVVGFFVLEGVLRFFYARKGDEGGRDELRPVVPLVVIGDAVHNFVDGLAIAAAFLISPQHGIIVTLAVAAHEIPQEIGDFAVMLHSGMKRGRVILVNILTSLVSTVSAVVFFMIGSSMEVSLTPLIGVTVGFFIYIAMADIMPVILQQKKYGQVALRSLILVAGVLVFGLVSVLLHDIIE